MAQLAEGRSSVDEGAWAVALRHAAGCPACRERLGQLAHAAASGAADEIPCAECQARLGGYLALAAAGEDAAAVYPRLGRHLARCTGCRAVAELLAPLARPAGLDELAAPARYPRFDTSFLAGPRTGERSGLAARLGVWWRRATGPPTGRRSESPASMGLLGAAAVFVLLLVALAATWAALRPEQLPVPIAPRGGSATPTATATRTPTPTATLGGGRGGAGSALTPGRPQRPAGATAPGGGAVLRTPLASPPPAAEPTERRRRPTAAPPGPTGAPPETPGPYPGPAEPTEGPTANPYPGPATAEPTATG
jgi:hypothetical protein